MPTSVGGQFLSIALEFLNDRRQCMCSDGKVSASVNVVSGVPQDSILRPLLFILYPCEFFHIVREHLIGYANNITIYSAIHRPFLHH